MREERLMDFSSLAWAGGFPLCVWWWIVLGLLFLGARRILRIRVGHDSIPSRPDLRQDERWRSVVGGEALSGAVLKTVLRDRIQSVDPEDSTTTLSRLPVSGVTDEDLNRIAFDVFGAEPRWFWIDHVGGIIVREEEIHTALRGWREPRAEEGVQTVLRSVPVLVCELPSETGELAFRGIVLLHQLQEFRDPFQVSIEVHETEDARRQLQLESPERQGSVCDAAHHAEPITPSVVPVCEIGPREESTQGMEGCEALIALHTDSSRPTHTAANSVRLRGEL